MQNFTKTNQLQILSNYKHLCKYSFYFQYKKLVRIIQKNMFPVGYPVYLQNNFEKKEYIRKHTSNETNGSK